MTDSKSLTFRSKGRLKNLTLEQLENILAEVPDRIAVSQYESVSDTMPRIVWNETRLSQTYGSNEADQMAIKVIVELISKPETARRDTSYGKSIEDVNDELSKHTELTDKMSSKLGEVGGKVEDYGKKASVVSGGIVAIGTASIAAFNEVDEGLDIIVKKTGATGEAMNGLEHLLNERLSIRKRHERRKRFD